MLSPADPADLIVMRGVDEAASRATWDEAMSSFALDQRAAVVATLEDRDSRRRARLVAYSIMAVIWILPVAALTFGLLLLTGGEADDRGTAEIEAMGQRSMVFALFASGSDRDWEISYSDEPIEADEPYIHRGMEAGWAMSDRSVPIGTTMEVARLGDQAVEVGHRPQVGRAGLPSEILWVVPVFGVALGLLFFRPAGRRRSRSFRNAAAIHPPPPT